MRGGPPALPLVKFHLSEQDHLPGFLELSRTQPVEVDSAGRYTTEWNGQGGDGSAVASGVYFYKIVACDFVQTRKMVLLK